MTIQDLQQLFYLNKLIDHEKERLDDLRSTLDLKSPALTDMPKAPGAKDKIGDIMPAIVDQEKEIEQNLKNYAKKRKELTDYINRAPNTRLKMIMILRFVEQKSWQEIADEIGGKETEYSVKHTLYRYLNKPY